MARRFPDGRIVVKDWVDSQNSFGAIIRDQFTCWLRVNPDSTATIDSIRFQDDKASATSIDQSESGSEPTTTSSLGGIVLGTPADSVLAIRGKPVDGGKTGSDAGGLTTEWNYPDVTYVMGRREVDGTSVYRVIAIHPTGKASTSTPSPAVGNQPTGKKAGRTMAALYASPFAVRYQLTAGEGWSVQKGEYNNSINTPTVKHAMLEMATLDGIIVEGGVMFLATPTLDPSQQRFVSDLLGWLDPQDTNDAALMRKINAALGQHVEHIMTAAPIKAGLITINAAHVGPDANISFKVK
jgi:hypothetical protein